MLITTVEPATGLDAASRTTMWKFMSPEGQTRRQGSTYDVTGEGTPACAAGPITSTRHVITADRRRERTMGTSRVRAAAVREGRGPVPKDTPESSPARQRNRRGAWS